ncbi:MAG: HDOD domain-containing protein [Desulfobacteraceae bacterium]|nr:HDOD domain-containing protein [Desulfobacteraceae bacterium]
MPTAEELINRFTSLKTLPHVAIRVTQLVNSEKSTMQDFEEVIRLDPVLVTRLLRLVNSPYFGLVSKVESISKAVVYVGMKNLRNLVTVEALRQLFTGREGEGFSRKNLWLHSATVAILAEMIAKRIFGREGEDYFLAGIIHDIGLIVEDQLQEEQLLAACAMYRQGEESLMTCEQKAIGTDHCQVGVALARDWKLPDEVLAAVRCHHDHERKFPLTSATSILQLAEYMAGKLGYTTIPGKIDPLPPPLVRHVRNMMANYKIIVRDLPQEMAKAKDLYETDAGV